MSIASIASRAHALWKWLAIIWANIQDGWLHINSSFASHLILCAGSRRFLAYRAGLTKQGSKMIAPGIYRTFLEHHIFPSLWLVPFLTSVRIPLCIIAASRSARLSALQDGKSASGLAKQAGKTAVVSLLESRMAEMVGPLSESIRRRLLKGGFKSGSNQLPMAKIGKCRFGWEGRAVWELHWKLRAVKNW